MREIEIKMFYLGQGKDERRMITVSGCKWEFW